MSEPALAILVALFVLAPFPATAANIYLWHKWRTSGDPRSWMLRTLAIGATVVNAASLFFGFLATRRVLGAEALDWTPPFSAVAALALEVVPVYFAVEFRRRERLASRRRGDG